MASIEIKILTKKYQFISSGANGKGICTECGGETYNRAFDIKTDECFFICGTCLSIPADPPYPYPVRITTRSNLKNHLGMGNQWLPRNPTKEFFHGISSHPAKRERIDFSSHVLYMAIWRAKKDGLVTE